MTDRTPETDDAYRAGPMVRIENTRAIDEATVTIPVDDADLEREGNLSIVTWEPHSDEPWVPVETEIDREAGTATAEVEHFSFFSVFWIDDWEDHTSDTITLEDEHLEGNETDVGGGEFTKADVVFVVDESGSMSGSRIENAREGAIRFVGALTEDEQAGVVGFSAGSSLRHELSTDHASVNETIEGLSTGGGTNTASGLSEGLAELERNGWENRSQVMILLADGHTNRGDDPVDVAHEAADRGIEISTIGLGSGIDENELREIAGTTGDDFYQVEDADDLPDTFERVAENQTGVELTDTNGDGIPDVVAEMDLAMPTGEPGVVGEPLELDPIALDTSGDGLLDNETVDINYRVHEENNETKLTAQVTYAAHHPARVDTTGDGLTDREQLEGWEIEIVDDHDDASSMMAAVSDPDDDTNPAQFFDTREVESNPLLSDTSGDGLTDVEELELGTDPKTTDTTGDGITDFEAVNRHDRHEDPTVFTTTAPSVNLLDYESGWAGDRFEFPRYTFQYQYQVEDAAGVSSSQLEQSGISGEYNTYHGPTSIVEFETIESESEGLLQWSRGVDTRITTEDIHGNDATRMFTVQRSVGSEFAAEFPWLDDEDMGLVSGWTHGAAELPDTVLMLWRSPDETAEALSELAEEYAKTQVDDDPTSESEFWLEMARGMSDSVHFQQHTDNPHDPPVANPDDFFDACGDELAAHGEPQSDYCEFAAGWYKGYAVFIIAETVGGTSSLKAADSVEDIADAAETAGRNMEDVHWGSRMDGPTSKTSRINQQLVTDGGRDISRLLEDVPSEAAPQVQRAANTIPEERFQALSRSHEELGHFLNRHGTDGAETINRFDDPSNAHQLLAASPDDEIVTTIVQVTNNHDVAPGSLMEIVNRGHDITHVGKTLIDILLRLNSSCRFKLQTVR
ncbi:vWA domain-containing protein [Natrialbaceae archaeon A-gly3]